MSKRKEAWPALRLAPDALRPSGFGLSCARSLILLLFAGVILSASNASGGMAVLYQTSFEAGEGYNTNLDLVGQKGWLGAGSGGNGIVPGVFPGKGQQAYIGFSPPGTNDSSLFVYQPLNKTVPRAQFAVTFSIVDSSNNNYDDFYWAVFNQQNQQLITLDFDNYELQAYYILEGGTNRISTGIKFTNNGPYQLTVTLDYTSNLWSAVLGTNVLATNQPITTSGAPLNLGDIDAAWVVYDPTAPGNNFMIFDDYQVSASVPRPQLNILGLVGVAPTLRLTGLANYQFAVEVSSDTMKWTPLKTNVTTGGFFDYVDNTTARGPQLFYRARWVP